MIWKLLESYRQWLFIGSLILCSVVSLWLGYKLAAVQIANMEKDQAKAIAAAVTEARETEKEIQKGLQQSLNNIKQESLNAQHELEELQRRPPDTVVISVPIKSVCLPENAPAINGGNEGSAELTDRARQDYYSLRKKIIETNETCKAARSYITECQVAGICEKLNF